MICPDWVVRAARGIARTLLLERVSLPTMALQNLGLRIPSALQRCLPDVWQPAAASCFSFESR